MENSVKQDLVVRSNYSYAEWSAEDRLREEINLADRAFVKGDINEAEWSKRQKSAISAYKFYVTTHE